MTAQETAERQKRAAAEKALSFVESGMVLGLGSGSTVQCFVELLPKGRVDAVVAASEETARCVQAKGILLQELNSAGELALYVDGADEVDAEKRMIKGGGGALTREKIIATASRKFVCMVNAAKQVDMLGRFPVAVEVIPMARSFVARKIVSLGGRPVYREQYVTDNGNVILDVYNLRMVAPSELEEKLNNIPGVVANGIFAARRADVVVAGTDQGVIVL